jgi:hypothetical protein
MPSLPNQPDHTHVHAPLQASGPASDAVPAAGRLRMPASLFLAGSRQRLALASGLIAALWLMVLWALD